MKRLGIIFNVIVLSALIVLVSAGVTLVHCNHTGNLSVAQLAMTSGMMRDGQSVQDGQSGRDVGSGQSASGHDNAGGEGECCGMEPECGCCHGGRNAMLSEVPCMDYTLISSQPTNSVNGFSLDFHPLYTILPDFFGCVVVNVPHVVVKSLLPECSGRHGPPRSYLRLITVLLI